MSKPIPNGNPLLDTVVPYDPTYLPAPVMVSANESGFDIPAVVRQDILEELSTLRFHRYPDPLANGLRERIAAHWGLSSEEVLVGNGGDELLFDLALGFGGQAGALLDCPPTFSVYAANAQITQTTVVSVPRKEDFSIDEEALLARLRKGGIGMVVLTSPNNPTGNVIDLDLIKRILESTNALVLVDEAYMEFADPSASAVLLIREYSNLAVLKTFSKAYACAGVRIGYLLAQAPVIQWLLRVRQPYSVDAISQLVASKVLEHIDVFQKQIDEIIAERSRLGAMLSDIAGVRVFPSQANFFLVWVSHDAQAVWQHMLQAGVLVRNMSATAYTQNCLRITVGTPSENDASVGALRLALEALHGQEETQEAVD